MYTCGVLAFTLDRRREIRQGRRFVLDLGMERYVSNVGTRAFHKNVNETPPKVRKKNKGKLKVKYLTTFFSVHHLPLPPVILGYAT